MVLYFDEYKEQFNNYGNVLAYYHKLPQMIHEMPADEMLKEMNRDSQLLIVAD